MINIAPVEEVYVIMGIDEAGNDHVLAVTRTFEDAKRYCVKQLDQTEYYDVWIEKHAVL